MLAQLAPRLAGGVSDSSPKFLLRVAEIAEASMRADHPGSYLHLSQPLRLDARPCTYMWPRKSHDAVPGQAAKLVQPSQSEWTRSADGVPFRFTDDVDVASDGTVYFTDASSKFGPAMHARDDIIEHGGHGRFLRYDPANDTTTVRPWFCR